MDFSQLVTELLKGFTNLTLGNLVMIAVGGVLIALAVVKEYEPVLLLPIGLGCLLANIPLTGMTEGDGSFAVLYRAGISTELFPLLIFIGVGAMIDFSPLLFQPKMVLLGDEDYGNFILMHAMGANTAGQLGSVMAGGVLLALVSGVA